MIVLDGPNEELAKEYGLMTDMNKIETHGEEKTR